MNKESKISIIITCYNKDKFIHSTISSCLSQNYKNFEIIIIDTGSTDKSRILINKFTDKKIKKLFLNKKFKFGQKNQILGIKKGLEISSGKIICLLDGDDIFHKNKLREINKIFTIKKNINFVQDKIKIIKNDNVINYDVSRRLNLFNTWPKFYPTSSFSIRKRSLFKFFKNDFTQFNLLEIDLRLFFYAKFKLRNHYQIKKSLSYYKIDNLGISSKFKRFSYEWFNKRLQAHKYLIKLLNFSKYQFRFDFFFTIIIVKLLGIFK